MINLKNRGLLLGMALLGSTALTGFNEPASAKPNHDNDVKDERKEIREDRKEIKDDHRDLHQDQRDLDREKRENHWDHRDNNGNNGRWDRDHDRNGRGDWDRDHHDRDDHNNNDRWDRDHKWDRNDNGRWDRNDRPGNYGGYQGRPGGYQGRPGGYSNGNNGGYGSGNNGGYGNNATSLQGVVTNDLSGNDFKVRLTNGQEVKVYAQRGEPGSLSRGDTVRVSGRYNGSTFLASNVSILNNR